MRNIYKCTEMDYEMDYELWKLKLLNMQSRCIENAIEN